VGGVNLIRPNDRTPADKAQRAWEWRYLGGLRIEVVRKEYPENPQELFNPRSGQKVKRLSLGDAIRVMPWKQVAEKMRLGVKKCQRAIKDFHWWLDFEHQDDTLAWVKQVEAKARKTRP
jgi:hypothetical protein